MSSHFPPIYYHAPPQLRDSWWRLMKYSGFSVRFYRDAFGTPSTMVPPDLTETPTPYGGWVYWKEKPLAIIFWPGDQTGDEGILCGVSPLLDKGLVVHAMMIASGLRRPHLESRSTPPPGIDWVISQIGGIVSIHRGPVLARKMRRELLGLGYDLRIDESARVLPEPYFVAAFCLGKRQWFSKERFFYVVTGPCLDPANQEVRQFAAIETYEKDANLQEAISSVEACIGHCGGRRIDFVQ